MESNGLPYDAIETLRTDGVAFIDLVSDHDPATSIPGCPDWNLSDLAYHQGEVWHFWGRIVAGPITERGQLQSIRQIERPTDDLMVDWLALTHNELFSALVDAGIDREVWTWTGANRDTGWVRRRMAQEAAVHRFDAANATGDPYEVPTPMAADGIDEFLMWFAGTERRDGEMKPGGTVHLHCTDTDENDVAGGEWFVSSLKEPSCTFTREHRKGDAAIRGRAHDILMWLWRRSTEGIEIIGDEVVARRFRAYTDLS
ncbi:maleylpyruvate isomerase family mycothiol-dependent enzyme [Ilumatobacter sp.]|uniref:maleylpyruvate isomerase family mycothiol-dependent enzyme n=1 Tax=Ilumatobacter sp. TaxID=1967498 RepID=UPI003C622A4D